MIAIKYQNWWSQRELGTQPKLAVVTTHTIIAIMVHCYVGFNGFTCWFTRIVNVVENSLYRFVRLSLSTLFSLMHWLSTANPTMLQLQILIHGPLCLWHYWFYPWGTWEAGRVLGCLLWLCWLARSLWVVEDAKVDTAAAITSIKELSANIINSTSSPQPSDRNWAEQHKTSQNECIHDRVEWRN